MEQRTKRPAKPKGRKCRYCGGGEWEYVQVSPSCDMDEHGDPISPRYEWRRRPCDPYIIHPSPHRRARKP